MERSEIRGWPRDKVSGLVLMSGYVGSIPAEATR